MNHTFTIAKRELMGLFFSPIAYVVLGLFALGTTLFFLQGFGAGQPAQLRPTLEPVVWIMIFLVPAISMRLLSEEYRSGTIEVMMTSPISDTQMVLGKWLGAMGFYLVLLLPLVLLTLVLEWYGQPDYGPIVSGMLGLMLVGGLYLAIGVFASSATQNQIIAFLLAVFIICIFTLATHFLAQAAFISPAMRQTMFYLNVNWQYQDFSKGLIDISNFVYFASGIGLFLFLAVRVLESRRWR